MKMLSTDWLTEGLLDAEYKKYLVLAYLQGVQARFGQTKLYPDLTELQAHYHQSLALRGQKGALSGQFRRRLAGLDPRTGRPRYELTQPDDACTATLDELLDFALPRFAQAETAGRQLDAEVEASLTLSPVGLLPLVRTEGYLLLDEAGSRLTRVYHYRILFFEDTRPPRRRVQTTPLETVRRGLTTPYEHLKLDLLRRHRHLPNPATFAVETRRPFPIEETLLPVVQRKVADFVGE